MKIFKSIKLPSPREHADKINLANPSSNNLERLARRAIRPSEHKRGASFHFRTVLVQDKMILLDGNDKIIKALEVKIPEGATISSLSDKEKAKIIIELKRELRNYANEVFIRFEGDTLQAGGFLFD